MVRNALDERAEMSFPKLARSFPIAAMRPLMISMSALTAKSGPRATRPPIILHDSNGRALLGSNGVSTEIGILILFHRDSSVCCKLKIKNENGRQSSDRVEHGNLPSSFEDHPLGSINVRFHFPYENEARFLKCLRNDFDGISEAGDFNRPAFPPERALPTPAVSLRMKI